MTNSIPSVALQLQSLIRNEGELEISLAEVEVPEPEADEVLVRIEAAPINPSDLGLLFGAADTSSGSFRHRSILIQRYWAYIAPPSMATFLPFKL